MLSIDINKSEMLVNNVKTLKLRKAEFKKNLIQLFSLAGYIFIVLLYLKNISFIRFAVRFALHVFLSNPFPNPYEVQMFQNLKKQFTKNFFYLLVFVNALFLIIDLISGVPHSDTNPRFLFGSITLQIIGETTPSTRIVYIYYNAIIFMSQYILIYLTTLLEIDVDSPTNTEPLPGSTYSINQIEGDGYTGLTTIASINPIKIYNEIRDIEITPLNGENDDYPAYIGNSMNQFSMY